MTCVNARQGGGRRVSYAKPAPDTMAALAAIFGAFPGMWRRVDRERYLPMIEDDLGVRLEVRYSGDMRRDIEAMLGACAEHWGGIWALVEALEVFYDNPEVRRLRAQVALHLAEPVLTAQERARLGRLLNGMEKPTASWLRRAYQIVAPWAPALAPTPANLLDVAVKLEDHPPRPGGIPSLVTFLDLVVNGADSPELHRLLDTVAARHVIAPEARRAARDSAMAKLLNERPVLVARLRPEADTDTFWLQVYLQWGSSAPELQHADSNPGALARARLVLDKLLHERDNLRGLAMTIEFVLPYDMLSEPVDDWHVGTPSYRLGHTYPVVVRTPDRHADTQNLAAWEQKWRQVQAHGDAVDPDVICWSPAADATRLSRDLVNQPRRVCLILPRPPEPVRDGSRLHAALAAGVVAVLWSRQIRDPADVETQLVVRSQACPVRQLPHLVLDLRVESHRDADPEHIGNGLTLLWDDYLRNPPIDMDLIIP